MPLIPKVGRKKLKVRFTTGVIIGVLWLGIALHLFPVWWMFTTSIKSAYEIFKFPPSLWPENPTFIAYKLFFYLSTGGWENVSEPIYVYMKNSVIISGAIMAIQVPITALIAYSISKLCSPKLSRFLFLFCIGTLMIPGQVALIPSYLILRHFPFPFMNIPKIPFVNIPFPTYNFLDTYWAVILPGIYNAFNVLLFKGFFDGIPDELINAARLDGSSEIGIFRRIVLPLSKPVFAVVAYFSFSGAWNNFIWPLIVIKKNSLQPLSVFLYRFQYNLTRYEPTPTSPDPQIRSLVEAGIGYNGLMAISIIESIPVFIIFLIFREYLMTGIKLRGFK